jgi:hypothetical protein
MPTIGLLKPMLSYLNYSLFRGNDYIASFNRWIKKGLKKSLLGLAPSAVFYFGDEHQAGDHHHGR